MCLEIGPMKSKCSVFLCYCQLFSIRRGGVLVGICFAAGKSICNALVELYLRLSKYYSQIPYLTLGNASNVEGDI